MQGSQEGGHPKVDCLGQNVNPGIRMGNEEIRVDSEKSIPKI